ncbi:MAG: hypothetical protein RI935_566 [Candidatus Parcubacteria bacterium]|jgi:hypothetical protein
MQFVISFSALLVSFFLSDVSVYALTEKQTARFFNGPTVVAIGSSDATFNLSQAVLANMTEEEKKAVYFEYFETNQVCIMIYPTPEYCLPKKTTVGSTTVTVPSLKPNTSYTVRYKIDNTIQCVTTPCPMNGFESLSVEFTTKEKDGAPMVHSLTKNLWLGSRGEEVRILQSFLKERGYFSGDVTGYFGGLTVKAVRAYQKENNITQSGTVGPLTRKSIQKKMDNGASVSSQGERFEGTITAYSTACFADGECSITVDGKKVITTIGWSQAVVGRLLGVDSIGDIENKIGRNAKVYAKKTEGGYTLYGSKEYFVEVR